MKDYLDLIWTFIKIGCMTFGGGYAMVPVLEREVMGKKNWITMDELMDYSTIAQITPGIIAVNAATFIGCKRKGPAGGIAATLSFLAPGFLVMIIVSVFITRFAEYTVVRHTFAGIRIAVGALILDTLLKLLKGVFADARSVVIFILAFCLEAALSASPVLVVTGAGIAGFFLYRKGKGGPEAGDFPAGTEGGG
ncbi:MAG: chromate transporter [Treponema sp.]|jgi:chromate transporter|nr:chromate transporter [Treponema sp.]